MLDTHRHMYNMKGKVKVSHVVVHGQCINVLKFVSELQHFVVRVDKCIF